MDATAVWSEVKDAPAPEVLRPLATGLCSRVIPSLDIGINHPQPHYVAPPMSAGIIDRDGVRHCAKSHSLPLEISRAR